MRPYVPFAVIILSEAKHKHFFFLTTLFVINGIPIIVSYFNSSHESSRSRERNDSLYKGFEMCYCSLKNDARLPHPSFVSALDQKL